MKRYEMVKLDKEFNNIIKNGKYIKNKYYVVYNLSNELNYTRFGLAVGKKIGNAVIRNKYKRRLRNIIDDNKKYFNKGQDYIIMLKGTCVDLKYNELLNQFISLVKEIK